MKAALNVKKGQLQEADALLQRAISDAGHLLNLLKITLPLLTGTLGLSPSLCMTYENMHVGRGRNLKSWLM